MIPATDAFERWLNGRKGFEGARVVSIEPVEGGASNLTCRVALADHERTAVCLRMQRETGIFQPYDVIREATILRILSRSPIPVPEVLATEKDTSALGAPFVVLEWVDAPHMGVAGPEASFTAYTEMVVAIHQQDWCALGLDFMASKEMPVEQAIASELDVVAARMPAFGCDTEPLLRDGLELLRARIPSDGRLALCQGDINVFNYLFRRGKVVAVVDWEQARISDPRSDVGQLVALAHLKGVPFGDAREAPFIRAYEASSGESLGEMAFFRARWFWELAIIHRGWVAFNGTDPWYSRAEVTSFLECSLAELP